MDQSKDSRRGLAQIAVCVALVAISWLVFGQTLRHDFVNYDDDSYVYENSDVTQRLTWRGVGAAFTHSDLYLWTPLTRISHMLDVAIYGLKPGGHHLTNLLLHVAAAIILFVALQKLTGSLWPSAFVAALFAIHPLHVESVAWISERKDVLSGLFFVLTLWTYELYCRNPRSLARYLLVVVFFALGLMSKPMLVTLPFVLLLLDYWPLQRFANRSSFRIGLFLEKLPLFLLGGTLVFVTLFDPFSWNAPRPEFSPHPLSLRISNAIVSYAIYVGKMFYPADLAVRYPFPASVPAWEVILSLSLLIFVSACAFMTRHRRPYLLVGWLWYLGMLVPVIGIVELGGEARSDRYTYLPQIGLYLVATWLAMDLARFCGRGRNILAAGAAVVLSALIWCARAQASTWRDSESLWAHTLAVTSGNELAHNNLGKTLLEKGDLDGARKHFEDAIRIQPNDTLALSNLGVALALAGDPRQGIQYGQEAARLKPLSAVVQNNLGFVFLRSGDTEEAVAHCAEALRIKPDSTGAHVNLGSAFLAEGKMADAVRQFREALQLDPDSVAALNDLAWILATSHDEMYRNGAEAMSLAQRAAEYSKGREAGPLDTLAAALAENGRFSEAITTATRAREAALAHGDHQLAKRISERLELYRRGSAYRE